MMLDQTQPVKGSPVVSPLTLWPRVCRLRLGLKPWAGEEGGIQPGPWPASPVTEHCTTPGARARRRLPYAGVAVRLLAPVQAGHDMQPEACVRRSKAGGAQKSPDSVAFRTSALRRPAPAAPHITPMFHPALCYPENAAARRDGRSWPPARSMSQGRDRPRGGIEPLSGGWAGGVRG